MLSVWNEAYRVEKKRLKFWSHDLQAEIQYSAERPYEKIIMVCKRLL